METYPSKASNWYKIGNIDIDLDGDYYTLCHQKKETLDHSFKNCDLKKLFCWV